MEKSLKGTEVADHMSFDTVRYSQLWEDSDLLNQALRIDCDDVVLSISSSGCNALALLLREPKKVVAVDLNLAQNALLSLKIAAFRNLDHGAIAELLGFVPSLRRLDLYRQIQGDGALGPYLDFWAANHSLMEKGLISQGRLDSFFISFAAEHFAKIPGLDTFKSAFFHRDLQLQKDFIPNLRSPAFRAAFVEYFGKTILEKGRDPAQFRYVTVEDVGMEFYNRFLDHLSRVELYGNHYHYFFFFGQPLVATMGPDYIQPKNHARLRGLVDRVEVKTASIERVLSEPASSFSKANLSDIFEYMSEENMALLLGALSDRMPKGGRVAYWNLLVDRPMPASLSDRFRVVPMAGPVDRIWFYKAFYVLERI